MEKTISDIMMKEHERILNFLDEFRKCHDDDLKKFGEIFSKFKWNLEKHMFVEEKAIFNVAQITTGEEVSGIFDLMQEHGQIFSEIKKAEKVLRENQCPEMFKLIDMLQKHAEFEDAVFYPKLDKILNTQQKEEIINRAEEIIRG